MGRDEAAEPTTPHDNDTKAAEPTIPHNEHNAEAEHLEDSQ
jgi:hypothetical protein